MKKQGFIIVVSIVLLSYKVFAQPFVDIVSFNCQTFSSTYKNNSSNRNLTDNYNLNFFVPKKFKNGNSLLIRFNNEMISSTITPDSSYTSKVYGIALPLGFQFESKNKKWKTVVIGIPKIASDFKDEINHFDFQLGGIFLENYSINEHLKFKVGLYYNIEAFGNFFVPLISVDWKASDRLNFYGVLPTNYKIEYAAVKNKFYIGLYFKSLTRSFRLSEKKNNDYVRYDEIQLKLFLDYFIYKKVLLFGELGYSLGKNPIQYKYNTNDMANTNPVYMPLKNYPIINIGIAYRIRFDIEKKD
jgi:hypothetical protein